MPPKRQGTTGPSQENWLANQEIIFQAWFGGMALDPALIEYMKIEHKFTATKGQYERKFAEWGWKKNLTAADLQYVLTRLYEREAAGKKSEATLEVGAFKMVIPAERLRKGKYRPKRADINDTNTNERGLSVHTPPPTQDDMLAIKYTLNHPHHGIVTLTASEPFVARGKASKRRRIRSPSPVGVVVNMQQQLVLVVRDIKTQDLPIFRFLEFIESRDFIRGITSSEQRSNYSDNSIYDIDGDDDSGSWIFDNLPSYSFSVPAVPEPFIYSCLTPYGPCPRPLNRTEFRNAILKHQGSSILERYDGDLEYRISRLLGPNDSDAFFEFLVFVMHSGANSVIPRKNTDVKQTLEGDSAKALLDLDTHHRLFSGNTQRKLEVAILLSHVELVKKLLDQGVDPNYLGSRRELTSPLEQACKNRDFRLIKQLVEAGADVNPSTVLLGDQSGGQVPLEWALQQGDQGDTHVLRYFLEKGARPIPGRQTHIKSLESYRILRQGGIETYFEPSWHKLMHAVIKGIEDDVVEYIAAGVDINKNLSKRIFGDLPRGNFECSLLKQLSFNCTLLQAAVENRHLGIVRILVKNNVDVNAAIYSPRGWSALEIAHSMGQTDIISELLQCGALFNSTPPAERTLVEAYYAFDNKDIEIIRRLLHEHTVDHIDLLDLTWEHTLNTIWPGKGHHQLRREALQLIRDLSGGDMNVMGPRTQRCVLELAVRLGDLEYAIHLFSFGARVKVDPRRCSQTFLKSIAREAGRGSDCSKLVGMVLKSGALAHEPDKGYDVFKIAVQAGFYGFHEVGFDMLRLLIRLGADVNSAARDFGRTALQHASHYSALVEFLLENGADVNAPAGKVNGRTALQVAAEYGHIKIVKRFLELGADPNARAAEIDGLTALEAAGKSGHLDTAVLLLDNGAVATERAAQAAQDHYFFVIAKIIRERIGVVSNRFQVEDGLVRLEG
ncbi:hypothetical protein EG329_001794 [Mollisiaceae sp. DMI_Dod_QoI]|nr:hypothetical protein EG329_001794 [Helotiales sp. DMI_Dod_QoI]